MVPAVYLAHAGFGAWGISAVLAEIAGIVYVVRYVANKNAEERKDKAQQQQELDKRQIGGPTRSEHPA